MKIKRLILFFVISVLISCTETRPDDGLPLPPVRLKQKFFSILPPDESGWLITHQDAHKLELGKAGTTKHENYSIQAWVIRLPRIFNNDAFLKHVSISLAQTPDNKRYKILTNDEVLFQSKQGSCVKFTSITEDKKPGFQDSNKKSLFIKALGLVCPHPSDHTVGVHVTYSHQHLANVDDPTFIHKALILINSLEFYK